MCKEWNYSKNKKLPSDYNANSTSGVWWVCEKGHEWKSNINNRNNGTSCPYCRGILPTNEYNLLVINPDLSKEWNYKKNKKLPNEFLPNSNQKVWWICESGHEWEAMVALTVLKVAVSHT